MAQAQAWTPYNSLTKPPTNLKEAIDWVLRVTGKDGKKNEKTAPAAPPSTSNAPHCLCYLAKAVKDLLYDAKDPGSPGPSQQRYWDTLLLDQEKTLVLPVLTDLGLLGDSTSAARDTCAGGTEVIKTLIDHLALGLQKWVGWQKGKEVCCLDTETGIGGKCTCPGGGAGGCCTGSSGTCTCASANNCYKSAYNKDSALWTNIVNGTTGKYPLVVIWSYPVVGAGGSGSAGSAVTVNPVKAAQDVHLLARVFLGSVCLIWSGLSQLGFLTCNAKGSERRWEESSLNNIENAENKGLASFMAAMGYDLDRIKNGTGYVVWKILAGKDKKNSIPWKEFASLGDKTGAQGAAKGSTTEKLCQDYPLLVLHILASGYFRAGSAGANKVTPAKPATSDTKKETPSLRKPRTIREILYWLSALPYSQGYKELVGRMQQKTDLVTNGNQEKDIKLYDDKGGSIASTTLQRKDITHYLMAACGYCPLVLIGIQGTINTSGTDTDSTTAGSSGSAAGSADQKKCPEHSKDRNKRCTLEDAAKAAPQAPAPAAASTGKPLEKGQVCYGGYHLAVKDFGPLHGMYANGLFGFDMGGSAAQCLDQLRVYVYHCFYQLYFLRKQCSTGAIAAGGGAGVGSGVVLGWKSCRYGYQVAMRDGKVTNKWQCTDNGAGQKCKCLADGAIQHTGGSPGEGSPLQSFLCDILGSLKCKETTGSSVKRYPDIEKHWTTKYENPPGHYEGAPKHCPVPMGWEKETNFKDLTKGTHKTADLSPPAQGQGTQNKYPAHCTGRTLSLLLEYYCDPEKCHGTLVVLLRLLACITPTVPRTLGDLFGFYYYIVYIGGNQGGGGGKKEVYTKLGDLEKEVLLHMGKDNKVVQALTKWNGKYTYREYSSTSGSACSHSTTDGSLKTLFGCSSASGGTNKCCPYLSPLSGQQYGQLSPAMAGTYLSWLCTRGTHGNSDGGDGVCKCPSVVSCTGVLPVLYKYGFGYGNVETLHKPTGGGPKKCDAFLTTLKGVLNGQHLKKDGTKGGLHHEINKLIYTTRLPWIFVLTLAWLVAVLYLAFGAIWPLDWTHMRSHCRGWFRKGSLSPWEVLMVGKKKGRGILEYFGGR
uniref:Variant erythrocyte surface antigen-1, putative n=1 Tax=Babesia bovis TaxID=5865 RepID=A7AXH6_BABBO|eukprot:XP_001608630.1 variant erythrocyte surface antigen-1 [Babesia bovis T2Bo]